MESFDLSAHGISAKTVWRNMAPSKLYEEAIRFEPGTTISDTGALIAYSGRKTGRSPQDKRLVKNAASADDIWWGPVIFEYYAGTEGNGFCAITSQEWLAHPGSVGKALLGELHIVGEDGNDCPTGEPGTIYFANGPVFEYHNDPKKTADARNEKGWSTLGDVGYVDKDGFLYLTDRKAFMIISGGVNIYPQEAENILINHPKVADVAVIGIPNEDFGEEVKAVVQPMDWADATPALAAELVAYCREHLSQIKCPRSVDFERELPRHPTGKLYKRLIRDRYWGNRDSKIV